MRVLVTGGAGFIGSHVVDASIAQGHDVCVVDDLSSGRRANVNQKARLYQVDICDREALERVFAQERPEAVNHHAAQIDVRRSVDEPTLDARCNILGSLNLLELAAAHGVARFVYASSGGAVYGDPQRLPADESLLPRPVCPYGVSKLAVEHYLHAYHQTRGLSWCALRYANVYGPRQHPRAEGGVIAIFCSQLLEGRQPTVFGDGANTRDYVFAADVVEANLLAMASDVCGAYNIGTGRQTSALELTHALAELTGQRAQPVHLPPRVSEVRRTCLSFARAERELGWRPRVPLAGKSVV